MTAMEGFLLTYSVILIEGRRDLARFHYLRDVSSSLFPDLLVACELFIFPEGHSGF